MRNDRIWNITNEIWYSIKEGCEHYRGKYPGIIFHEEKKEDFDELYKNKYKEIMKRFMTSETNELDSHKQAALITICCLELEIIECPEPQNNNADELFIIPQMIAISVGLSFMLQCLNDLLQKRNIKKRIERYIFPVALACDTKYEKIICRILYQEQHEADMDFNVLELSDRYFLLEYINLLQYGIEPNLLKEKDSAKS